MVERLERLMEMFSDMMGRAGAVESRHLSAPLRVSDRHRATSN